jgi:hypothetical protein
MPARDRPPRNDAEKDVVGATAVGFGVGPARTTKKSAGWAGSRPSHSHRRKMTKYGAISYTHTNSEHCTHTHVLFSLPHSHTYTQTKDTIPLIKCIHSHLLYLGENAIKH